MNSKLIEYALHETGLLADADGGEVEILSVGYDSREVHAGELFFCKGAAFKPEYLTAAVKSGAVCYIAERRYDVEAHTIIVNDIRRAMAVASAAFYGNPENNLDILAVTGTKGKTTTSFITRALLEAGGMHYGLLSSVLTDTGLHTEEAHLTTPESPDLLRMFSDMCDAGLGGAVMEVSSQGLAYDRVYGLHFGRAAFLNIGEDHISPIEHKDFGEYFSAKKKIFSLTGEALVNLDDQHSAEIIGSASAQGCSVATFGFDENADIRAYDMHREDNLTKFRVRTKDFDRMFSLPLMGAFNVYNALAAIGFCMGRVTPGDMVRGMRRVRVPGRMEVFERGGVTVIVDYAHNRLSFESLFSGLRKDFPGRRIVAVYGCPGGKAFLRRSDLGEVAGKLADLNILTAEDPNMDDVDEINAQIASHIKQVGGNFISVPDRKTAVIQAIMSAKQGDVIAITGKGEETYQKVRGVYEPFEGDIPLTKKYLRKRAAGEKET